jgi:hypothetical protein
MSLSPQEFTEPVARLLAECAGSLLPLSRDEMSPWPGLQPLEDTPANRLFPGARQPDAALSGLYLRLGAWEECHERAQNISTPEGNYWHAIVHRIEPDSWNSNYWFRRVGQHPIFPDLRARAAKTLNRYEPGIWRLPPVWDPSGFVAFCDEARNDIEGPARLLAFEIQDAEWELLFTWCASPVLRVD